MDLTEAKAMRKRLMREVDNARAALDTFDPNVGSQRDGPRYKRMVKALQLAYLPVLLLLRTDTKSTVLIHLIINQYGQMKPAMTKLKKRGCKFETSECALVFTVHAIDRLIQYYSVRDVSTMHPNLLSCFLCVWNYTLKEGIGQTDKINMVDRETGLVLGHFIIDSEAGTIITWVGSRSYTSNQRDLIMSEYGKNCA